MAIKTPTNNKEEPGRTETREIPVEEPQQDETVPVDFQSEDIAQQFAGAHTKPSDDGPKIDPNKSADDIAKELNDYEASKTAKLKYQDLQKFAEWIINLLDTTVASILKWVARDSSLTAYQMPKQSKEMLIEQLAILLSRYQSKFRVEFVFFMGLLLVWGPPTYAAIQSRKNNAKQTRADNRIKRKIEEEVQQTKPEPSSEIPVEKISSEPLIPVKRRGGRPRKIAS